MSSVGSGLHVDFDRLKRDIEALAAIGRVEDHSIYRMAFSDGDMAGRRWLEQQIEDAGLVWSVIESMRIPNRVKLGQPGRFRLFWAESDDTGNPMYFWTREKVVIRMQDMIIQGGR